VAQPTATFSQCGAQGGRRRKTKRKKVVDLASRKRKGTNDRGQGKARAHLSRGALGQNAGHREVTGKKIARKVLKKNGEERAPVLIYVNATGGSRCKKSQHILCKKKLGFGKGHWRTMLR